MYVSDKLDFQWYQISLLYGRILVIQTEWNLVENMSFSVVVKNILWI